MSKTARWDVQKLVYEHLKKSQKLIALIGDRLFDTFVPSPQFPYVVLGLGSYQPWSSKTFKGADHFFPIHIWSSYQGQKEVIEIADCIEETFATEFPVLESLHIVNTHVEQFYVQVDQDNQLMHGILKLRIRAHEL